MSIAATLDSQKVDSTVSTLEQTERVIISGSDEHLDILIDLNNKLSQCVKCLDDLVDAIEDIFNQCTPKIADQVIVKVFPVLSAARKITTDLYEKGYDKQVRDCLTLFEQSTDSLFEILTDLTEHKSTSADPDEFYF